MSFSRDATGRLRAIWRVLAFVLLFYAGTIPVVLVRRLLAAYPVLTPPMMEVVSAAGLTLAALLATHVMLRYVEHRPWSMVMLDRPALEWRGMALGGLAGVLPIGIPSALLFLSGWLSRESAPSGNWFAAAIMMTFFLLPAAFVEEVLVRGYPFAVVREAGGLPAAVVSTSVVFGVLHAPNPGATVQSIVIVTLSGIFLGVLLVVTRSLYAATLAHAAWNWVMAVVLHTNVSGLPHAAPNYRIVDSGPDWATGGAWGPEAGIPAALGMALMIPFLMKFGQDQWRSPLGALSNAATNGGPPGDPHD